MGRDQGPVADGFFGTRPDVKSSAEPLSWTQGIITNLFWPQRNRIHDSLPASLVELLVLSALHGDYHQRDSTILDSD